MWVNLSTARLATWRSSAHTCTRKKSGRWDKGFAASFTTYNIFMKFHNHTKFHSIQSEIKERMKTALRLGTDWNIVSWLRILLLVSYPGTSWPAQDPNRGSRNICVFALKLPFLLLESGMPRHWRLNIRGQNTCLLPGPPQRHLSHLFLDR